MRHIHTRELDAFVAECDRLGGLGHPDATAYAADFRLSYDTRVDQSLDPFSDEYYAQQLALYAEIAGRPLDQLTGEQMPLDVDARVSAANPYGVGDVAFVARNARTIHTCLMMANLPCNAAILDAGSGWGMSTEMMAFCGAEVTALDINPRFVELVRRRAERLGLPITAVCSPFDTFDTDRRFDLLYFYECLHHSPKPWQTVERLGRFVKPDGKVVFAGEPIDQMPWANWGMRLDEQAVYCIRKFGWWEGGWTASFITAAFARAGFELQLFPHVGIDNRSIGIATRQGVNPRPPLNLSLMEPFRPSPEMMAELAALRHQVAVLEHAHAGPCEPGPLRERVAELETAHAALAELRAHAAALEHALADVTNSRSWKVTAPMRFLLRKLGLSRGTPGHG